MRANKTLNYPSILQQLGESGCPFCRFLKDFQAAALQSPGKAPVGYSQLGPARTCSGISRIAAWSSHLKENTC
jgi:hypothetical protein